MSYTADSPIVGAPLGTQEAAVRWFTPRAKDYTLRDVEAIVAAYIKHGAACGVDWFLALAQMAHETGNLTSWWSARPRRNPAGIAVTGHTLAGRLDLPPGHAWTWDGTRWREGWSFPNWAETAVPAHIGRLLAYARTDARLNAAQHPYVAYALVLRPLPADFRGCAPTIVGLNGKWAVPGPTYGQGIVALANQMMRAA